MNNMALVTDKRETTEGTPLVHCPGSGQKALETMIQKAAADKRPEIAVKTTRATPYLQSETAIASNPPEKGWPTRVISMGEKEKTRESTYNP